MTTLRRFTCDDLYTFNGINLDPLTETVRCLSRLTCSCRTAWACKARWRRARPLAIQTSEASRLVQYNFSFYLEYLARWPEFCQMAVGTTQNNMGYSALRP